MTKKRASYKTFTKEFKLAELHGPNLALYGYNL